MPNWIIDAVIKRFDERSIQMENIKDIALIKNQLIEMEKGIMNKLSEDDQQLVQDWLDQYVQMTAIQNEWLYTKGIQDGLQIMIHAQLEERL